MKLRLPLPSESGPDPNRNILVLRDKGVRYVVATGAIADRVLAAKSDYPKEAGFYDDLSTLTKRVFYVRKDGLNGPWVAVYQL